MTIEPSNFQANSPVPTATEAFRRLQGSETRLRECEERFTGFPRRECRADERDTLGRTVDATRSGQFRSGLKRRRRLELAARSR